MIQSASSKATIQTEPDPAFDQIAVWYDTLNAVITCGLDSFWRHRVAENLHDRGPLRVLDLACGTGKQISSLFSCKVPLISVNGIDLSERMLSVARRRFAYHKNRTAVFLEQGDATALRFENDFFDAVTISFGLGCVNDSKRVLNESWRVLKLDCPLIILEINNRKEFSFPWTYSLYIKHIIPVIGGLIAGSTSAYRKIMNGVERIPESEQFLALLKAAGFHKIQIQHLFPGFAAIYICKKRNF